MKSFRIAEIFGPTIQGEGRHIGVPCHFIRFGGCDYRCTWCDSPHAVLPELVAQLPRMTEEEIVRQLRSLPLTDWVVFSGGNPALLDLDELVKMLFPYRVMVETQGTVWNEWLNRADEICVSPKPPSSGNRTSLYTIRDFLEKCRFKTSVYLKIVVFDEEDYIYARTVARTFDIHDIFFSVGNEDPYLPTVENPNPKIPFINPQEARDRTRREVLTKMTWLMETLAADREMRHVRVLPQMHVLAWGNQRGR